LYSTSLQNKNIKFLSAGKEVEGVMVSACPLDGDLYKRPYNPKKQTMLEYIRQFPCSFCFQMKDEKANVFVAPSPEFYQFKI
jgi:hypothetical protein